MNELVTQLGVGGGFAVIMTVLAYRFIKDQKTNGLPVIQSRLSKVEETVSELKTDMKCVKSEVSNIDGNVKVLIDRSERS